MHHSNEFDYLEIRESEFTIHLDPNLENCLSIKVAARKYQDQLFFDDVAPELKDDDKAGKLRKRGTLKRLILTLPTGVQNIKCELLPHAKMDEAYNVTVSLDPPKAVLMSATNWGIIRGLETISQLIFQTKTKKNNPAENDDGDNFFGIRPVEIEDAPRFTHRGLMLDTARHYISLDKIIPLIDAMAYNKLNVFHWHLTDDQSFPFESEVFPQLSKLNSFRPELTYGKSEVRMVILYAALWGIRVIPELDTPGHSYSMRHIPNLLTECYDTKTESKNGDFGPINPTKATAYKAVDSLLTELNSLFVDKEFHAGGDEVDFDCWKSNPEISRWMVDRNISGNYEELTNYYIRRLHHILTRGHNRTMIVWQEVFDMGANLSPKNTIVHVWKDINHKHGYMAELAKVTDAGYHSILSSCWYLNYIDYGRDWQKFYECDPRGKPVKDVDKVLGGEICMWTEFVDDTNVLSRIWPRASAAAERLWSQMQASNIEEFVHRLEQHRCRLISRGIDAEPVNGPGYC